MIATRRLVLRRLTPADVPKMYAMSIEAGMRRWIPDQVYRDLAHAEEVTRTLAGYTALPPEPRARPFVLGLALVEDGTLIGHVGLSAARGSVEIGYAIEEAREGQGFATEGVEAMSAWGLDTLGLPEVLGIVGVDNIDGRGDRVAMYRRTR